MILALDLGTTNWKAAVFSQEGQLMALARIDTPIAVEDGFPCYDAHAVPEHLARLLTQIDPALRSEVRQIALTGMAEAGLILDRQTLAPLSSVWPWFDRRTLPLFDRVGKQPPFVGRENITGLPNSFKYGIYKFLTLLETGRYDTSNCLWMGFVAYATCLLTGETAEDVTIAARTFALNVHTRDWDDAFLAALSLSRQNFPRLVAPGEVVGELRHSMFGLPAGIPVSICGHDHVCAAHACGLLESGGVFVSTGTAQVMLGTRRESESVSGLSYGPSPAGAPYTCLGSIQSAGGSINYWRKLLFPGEEDYAVLLREAQDAPNPTSLTYFPYLGGSGAPHLDPHARGALLGLSESTSRGEIIAAVYEGVALESRYLLSHMESCNGLICMGGLTRHRRYIQTLADVTGLPVSVPGMDEGTLYGAARLAAKLPPLPAEWTCHPDPVRHAYWTNMYNDRYLPLMKVTQQEE